MNRYFIGGLLAFAVALACTNNSGPTRPSSVPEPLPPPSSVASPTPSSPAPTPTVEDPVADNGGGLNARWTIGENRITVRVQNLSDSEQPVTFACYRAPRGVNELADQVLDSHESELLEPGTETRITLTLPACEWQCDVSNRSTPREPPFYTERELVGFRDSVQVGLDLPRECAPPPPPPPPPPVCNVDELEATARQECGELGFELDIQACTFECGEEPPDPCEGVSASYSFSEDDAELEACAGIDVTPNAASWSVSWGDGDEDSGDGDIALNANCHGYGQEGSFNGFVSIFAPGPEGAKCDEQGFLVDLSCPYGSVFKNGKCKPVCPAPGLQGVNGGECVPYCEVYPDAPECQPQQCIPPNEGTYFIPPGERSPEKECAFFGDFDLVEKEESFPWDLEDGDFYLCKAGNDWELTYDKPSRFGLVCGNGKLRSHITVCECPD